MNLGGFAHVAERGRSFGGELAGEFEDFETGGVDRLGAAKVEHDTDSRFQQRCQIGHDLGHVLIVDRGGEAEQPQFERFAVDRQGLDRLSHRATQLAVRIVFLYESRCSG